MGYKAIKRYYRCKLLQGMAELFGDTWEYITQIGTEHNVNPVVFAVLYVVTIPTYLGSMAWAVRNKRNGKEITIPVISTLINFILPAMYILIFGRGVAWWVYLIIAFIILYGGFSALRKLNSKLRKPTPES